MTLATVILHRLPRNVKAAGGIRKASLRFTLRASSLVITCFLALSPFALSARTGACPNGCMGVSKLRCMI